MLDVCPEAAEGGLIYADTIAIMGRLTHTPELRITTSGKEVCSFDIACERSYSANGQRETDFIPCVAWGKTAQFISQYFDKGSMIAVNGSLQTRKYQDKQGNNRTAYEIQVREVSFCGSKAPDSTSTRGFDEQTESLCQRSYKRSERPAGG
mgnify:CR=1 FL=1